MELVHLFAGEVAHDSFADKVGVGDAASDIFVAKGTETFLDVMQGDSEGPFRIDQPFADQILDPLFQGRIPEHQQVGFKDQGMFLDYVLGLKGLLGLADLLMGGLDGIFETFDFVIDKGLGNSDLGVALDFFGVDQDGMPDGDPGRGRNALKDVDWIHSISPNF